MSICILRISLCICLMALLVLVVIPSFAYTDFESDTILQGQQLRDWQVLYSANKAFKLQFFSPAASKSRYVAIFIHARLSGKFDGTKPVWIGNRNDPIGDASGALTINDSSGMLNILHGAGNVITISSGGKGGINPNTSATLQNDGNLVLREVYPNGSMNGTVLWQSFDYPTDVLIPGMKLGIDLKTGYRWSLTSWVSESVPSPGSFTLGVDMNATRQIIIWWHGSVYWTSGVLSHDDDGFENSVSTFHKGSFKFMSNDDEKTITYSAPNVANLTPVIYLTSDGELTYLAHCLVYSEDPRSGCASYSYPECMKNPSVFHTRKMSYIRGTVLPTGEQNISISDCKARCIQNCSCYAYASLYENGTGCQIWDDDEAKQDFLRYISVNYGDDRPVYFRRTETAKDREVKAKLIWLTSTVGGALLLLSITLCIRKCCRRLKGLVKRKDTEVLMMQELVDASTSLGKRTIAHEIIKKNKDKKMLQVHLFSFEVIDAATQNFSLENKLGEGGFGPVYKGKLLDGQEIAVKRLARSSSQGSVEFKNEIQLIVKLQHNNLVRLLGCCIHKEEMMLVYEFMPNKSLDFFLFNPTKRALLDWKNRMNIIEGIAQGLLYLHKYSRLKVIHRDLKASNILLDQNMTPKISDFGMAKIFDIQDIETNTKRIVGTYGYMSPEYAINGVVSTKTDVFSFGVLLLEIVSGKKNRGNHHPNRSLNLISLAWELWIEGSVHDLVDTTIDVSNKLDEVKRCINLGLLCVQDSAADRPSMTDVLSMLKCELLQLPTPKQPAFYIATCTIDKGIEENQNQNCSNRLSTSIMEAR